MKDIVERRGIRLRSLSDLAELNDICGVGIQVLWPEKDLLSKGARAGDINDASMVVRIRKGDMSVLFPGDITVRAEQELVRRLDKALESRVLVLPHHGSKTSSSEAFLEAVNPECTLISVGYRNRFAMPHHAVLKRLDDRKIRVYRTDREGAIRISISDKSQELTPVLNEVRKGEQW